MGKGRQRQRISEVVCVWKSQAGMSCARLARMHRGVASSSGTARLARYLRLTLPDFHSSAAWRARAGGGG